VEARVNVSLQIPGNRSQFETKKGLIFSFV
jgi:hypothetical protein